MKEIGEIIELKETYAVIRIKRSSSCDRCGVCKFGSSGDEMLLTIPNQLHGKPGDWVELDLDSVHVLRASFITYSIPLVSLILGVAFGYFIGARSNANAELLGAVCGILFTALTFLGIRIMEPHFKKSGVYSPRMVNIISRSHYDIENKSN